MQSNEFIKLPQTRCVCGQSIKLHLQTTFLLRFIGFILILFISIGVCDLNAAAQDPNQWTPQQTIPDYDLETDPPILVADQNRTVHAFSSQTLEKDDDEGKPILAIMYNQWTLEEGWTTPIDILLSPLKNAARMQDAFLDNSGTMHVIFFGGDETEANIYYSQAPAARAGEAPAWSKPIMVGEAANNPDVAALAGDDQGNLVIVYAGWVDGWGLYTVYSGDGGKTWSEPVSTFLTYAELFPVILKLSRGQSGLIHAVWDNRDRGGNGREINYARLNLTDRQWSEPMRLAEEKTGYGVLVPTVIEHRGELFVAYSGITIQRSGDGGQTWSPPISPFRHSGINGTLSFVIDSNDNLHILWAQRITGDIETGNPDIHGVWHSMWHEGLWTEPEPVVSGPQVTLPPDSTTGLEKAFDPYDVKVVVVQGNILLATWRTDPGGQSNGVWYSYRQIETPSLPVRATPFAEQAVPAPVTTVTTNLDNSTPTATSNPGQPNNVDTDGSSGSVLVDNPAAPIVVGMVPVILFISIIVVRYSLVSKIVAK